MPLRKVHELTFLWFGLPGPLLKQPLVWQQMPEKCQKIPGNSGFLRRVPRGASHEKFHAAPSKKQVRFLEGPLLLRTQEKSDLLGSPFASTKVLRGTFCGLSPFSPPSFLLKNIGSQRPTQGIPESSFWGSQMGIFWDDSTPNVTGRRFHRTMEMIPAVPWLFKTPFISTPVKQSTKQGNAKGASEVRRGTSSIHFHCPAPCSSSHIGSLRSHVLFSILIEVP